MPSGPLGSMKELHRIDKGSHLGSHRKAKGRGQPVLVTDLPGAFAVHSTAVPLGTLLASPGGLYGLPKKRSQKVRLLALCSCADPGGCFQ